MRTGMRTQFLRRFIQPRKNPDVARSRGPSDLVFTYRMSISDKPSIVWEPSKIDDFPGCTVLFQTRRLSNCLGRASFNVLYVYSLRIHVRKVLAVGRDRPARDRVLRGIDGELTKLNIRRSRHRRRVAFREPDNRADD